LKETADESTTVNADINSIIGEHFDWDRKVCASLDYDANTFPYSLFPIHPRVHVRLLAFARDHSTLR
jgi:hypothetical protein